MGPQPSDPTYRNPRYTYSFTHIRPPPTAPALRAALRKTTQVYDTEGTRVCPGAPDDLPDVLSAAPETGAEQVQNRCHRT